MKPVPLRGRRAAASLKAENPMTATKSRPWLFVRIREAGDAR
ncbi:hypothetical protein [Mesotoga prima]